MTITPIAKALKQADPQTALWRQTVLWHNAAAVWIASGAILRGRQNPRADGHGRPLADLAQGRKHDHFQQKNLNNRRAQTENANPPTEIAADRKTPLVNKTPLVKS